MPVPTPVSRLVVPDFGGSGSVAERTHAATTTRSARAARRRISFFIVQEGYDSDPGRRPQITRNLTGGAMMRHLSADEQLRAMVLEQIERAARFVYPDDEAEQWISMGRESRSPKMIYDLLTAGASLVDTRRIVSGDLSYWEWRLAWEARVEKMLLNLGSSQERIDSLFR